MQDYNLKKELFDDLNNPEEISKSDFEDWIKRFVLSGLGKADKTDILTYAKPVFLNFKKEKFSKSIDVFIRLVNRNKFLQAVRFSKYLSYQYDEMKEDIKNIIKKRGVYIVSPKLDMEMGGLGHIIVQRANYLAEQGYDTTIINTGPIKNYDYIQEFYQNENRLSKDIKFYNFLKYYSDKNSTGSKNPTLNEKFKDSEEDRVIDGEYVIKKILNNDNSTTLLYLDSDDNIIKTEKYIDGCLIFRESDDFESYFTPDGFKYYELDKNTKKSYLNERASDITIEFKTKNQFLNHFITELCLGDEKPFLICDSTTHWYNINWIDLKDAFKIACLHGNPFTDFDPEKGLNPRINHFKKFDEHDKIVILTESLKNDLKGHADISHVTVIPNFISDSVLSNDEVEKDLSKIAVFSRIAPIKQMSHMIEAFKIVAKHNTTAFLDIYGGTFTPDEEEELVNLKKMVKEYNLEDRINFNGYVDDVNTEMKKSLFSLLTSKMEGLSVSSLELMGNSTPIISYDVRYGPSDLITNDVDGILLENNDIEGLASSILKLLNNPEDTIEMGRKAKKKIQDNFLRTPVCKKWEDLFIEVFIEREIDDAVEAIILKEDYERLLKKNKKLSDENKELKNEVKSLSKYRDEVEDLSKFKDDVLSSKSWKITKHLRKRN